MPGGPGLCFYNPYFVTKLVQPNAEVSTRFLLYSHSYSCVRLSLMKKILGIILFCFLLASCVPTTSEFYSDVSFENKVIGMPSSNRYLAKDLKKLFRKNGWKVVVVDTGTVKTTGSSTDLVNLEAEYKPKTSYVVSLSQTLVDWCMIGNSKISFDLTIINSKTGEETFVAEGNDCTKTIIKDLEIQLAPFWN